MLYRFMYYAMNVMLVFFPLYITSIAMKCKSYAYVIGLLKNILTYLLSTWLGDHQGRPSATTNSLHTLHLVHYPVQLTITILLQLQSH